MFERFKILHQLWRSGRLALRLLRDHRVPVTAKLVFGAVVMYMLSPIDVVPDWIPVFGQADDLMVLLAGFNLFLRACPRWLVNEHDAALGGGSSEHDAAPRATTDGVTAGPTIEGDYRRMR